MYAIRSYYGGAIDARPVVFHLDAGGAERPLHFPPAVDGKGPTGHLPVLHFDHHPVPWGVITSYSIHYTKLYDPGGAAILLEVVTDNRNRTVSEIRAMFGKRGGNLGENGCVAWMFDQKGLFVVNADGPDEDELLEMSYNFV